MVRGNINFTPKGSMDIRSIAYWYNQQKDGLADEFLNALDAILRKVERHPTSFIFIKRNTRRCKLKKFPYYIYFSRLNSITVLRVRHIKQQPLKRFT